MARRFWQWLIHSYTAALVLRLAVGAVFLYASADKIVHPDRFAELMQDYALLPRAAVNLAAVWLAWLELVVGIMLVAGIWLRTAALLTTGLSALFLGALVIVLSRGMDIHCGCFSTSASGNPRTWLSLWHEGLLLLACLALLANAFASLSTGSQDKL